MITEPRSARHSWKAIVPGNRFATAVGVGLPANVLPVAPDRVFGNAEAVSDLFVAEALRNNKSNKSNPQPHCPHCRVVI